MAVFTSQDIRFKEFGSSTQIPQIDLEKIREIQRIPYQSVLVDDGIQENSQKLSQSLQLAKVIIASDAMNFFD